MNVHVRAGTAAYRREQSGRSAASAAGEGEYNLL